jgi:hypothetical protein
MISSLASIHKSFPELILSLLKKYRHSCSAFQPDALPLILLTQQLGLF